MPQSTRPRRCSREKESGTLPTKSQRICLPIERVEYERMLGDRNAFRKYMDEMVQQHPELFPATIQQGYQLHDLLPPSKKMPKIQRRRIKMKTTDNREEVFSIAPSYVMPYMTGYTVAPHAIVVTTPTA